MLPIKSFQTLVNDQVTAIQAASNAEFDFATGSIPLALVEANASMGIWLEYLINAVLALARASTSTGVNLDSWMAQFQFTRLPATQASGNVVFSRFNTTGSASVPVGAQVKTTNFAQAYTVIADPTNPNYNPSLMAYILNSGISTTDAKVQAINAGTQGNAVPNTITVISSPITGIDNVNNTAAIVNGQDAESDDAFRARFILYINSLSRAVKLAVENALAGIPAITRYGIVENQTFAGGSQPGFFYAVIDDGTGTPPPSLIAQATAAIERVRGLSIQFAVYAPLTLNVNITVDLTIDPTADQSTVTSLVTTALTTYINTLPFDAVLPYTKVYEVIYDASPNILNVTNLTVNGGSVDLPAVPNQIFVADIITVSYL